MAAPLDRGQLLIKVRSERDYQRGYLDALNELQIPDTVEKVISRLRLKNAEKKLELLNDLVMPKPT